MEFFTLFKNKLLCILLLSIHVILFLSNISFKLSKYFQLRIIEFDFVDKTTSKWSVFTSLNLTGTKFLVIFICLFSLSKFCWYICISPFLMIMAKVGASQGKLPNVRRESFQIPTWPTPFSLKPKISIFWWRTIGWGTGKVWPGGIPQ